MFKTHEIAIGRFSRLIVGALGILGLGLGLVFTTRELWYAFHGEWLRLLAATFFIIVLAGGLSLLRSAVRGRLSVRSHRAK